MHQHVHSILAEHAAAIQQRRANQWTVRLAGPEPVTAQADLDEQWFTLRASMPREQSRAPTLERLCAMTKLNADLPPGVRVLQPCTQGGIKVWGEAPAAKETLGTEIRNLCIGLQTALACLRGTGTPECAHPHRPRTEPRSAPDLEKLCRATRWKDAAARGDGAWTVPVFMGPRESFAHPIVVRAEEDGGLRVSVDLVDLDAPKDDRWEAALNLLLGARVRWVRVAAADRDGDLRLRCEVRLPDDCTPLRLQKAFDGLSYACMEVGLEAQVVARGARMAGLLLECWNG